MIRLSKREAQKLGDRLNDPKAFPLADPAAVEIPVETLQSESIDDATTLYVVEMRDPFDRLRQAESQLAGLLVLASASGHALAGHPMLEMASNATEQAIDEVRSIKVPPRARHHHHHVLEATKGIASAVAAARRVICRHDDRAIDAVLVPLRSAHQHLLWATGALPGFEVVALSQACCTNHAGMPSRVAQ